MDLDPVVALALSIHAAPGTFALLVGSGISRTAQVPTGWDVVVDLIRQVAWLSEGSEPTDPAAWYREVFGADPDYSLILERLAATGADRRNLLNGYFEPTPEEREQGLKMPTRAHRAIAELVASGCVRVIVTTNFDRLLEAAIRDAGVEPVVISTPAAAGGATPLAHSRCTIIKVHGDYLDPDLKNTVDELGAYDPAIDQILDRVFDEYGLVVCGWSGEWDEALRNALLRAPGRRYGSYWVRVGDLGPRAAQLVAHRGAIDVPITGADEFFEALAAKVATLAEAMDRRPLSTALAIAELKRYLPDPVHRIRLHDLVMGEVSRVAALPPLDTNQPQPTAQTTAERMHQYESAVAALLPLLATLACFADRPEHDALLVDALRRLVTRRREHGGFTLWMSMELYPALLALYAVGLGALAGRRVEPLAHALSTITVPHPNGPEPLVEAISSWRVLDAAACNAIVAPGERRKTPTSDYLHDLLREPLRPVVAGDDEYSNLFDELEYLLGVVCTSTYGRGPVGRFVWRGGGDPELTAERVLAHRDALLAAGLFAGESSKLDEANASYVEELRGSSRFW
jgi:hypothetical protein